MITTRAALIALTFTCLAAAAAFAAAPAAPKKIRWEPSFSAALKKAKAEKKAIMIDFWAEWCGWCFELEKTTYRDKDIVARAQELVSVKVDTEGSRSEKQLATEYRIETLPTIAFVSPQGRPILRVTGFHNSEEFTRVLDRAQKKTTDILAWEAALETNPNDAFALYKLGAHLFDLEFYEDSRSLLRRAAAADKDRPSKDRKRARTLLGIILLFESKPAEAEPILKEAVALEPPDAEEDPAALFTLAKAHIKLGKNAEARTLLQKVADKYPDSIPAGRAKAALETLPVR